MKGIEMTNVEERLELLSNARELILNQFRGERVRQIKKWGIQDIPFVDKVLMNRPGGCTGPRMCEEFGIPSEVRAKYMCNSAHQDKTVTFAHIIVEELSEAVEAAVKHGEESDEFENELVQVAACVLQALEMIRLRRFESQVVGVDRGKV